MTLYNSTLANNTSTGATGTGGVFINSLAVTFNMTSTILAGNSGNTSKDLTTPTTFVIAGTNNLIGEQDSALNWSADSTSLVGPNGSPIDPGLNALADNGGTQLLDGTFVQTRGLKNFSQARENGTVAAGFSTDQRGAPRSQGATIDIGAYEASPLPNVSVNAPNITTTGPSTFDVTVTFKDALFGINTTTIDQNDIVVKSLLGGITLSATTFTVDTTNPNNVIVTYTFDAPDNAINGQWDASDTDQYQVWIMVRCRTVNANCERYSPAQLNSFLALLGGKALKVDVASDVDDGKYSSGNLTLREAIDVLQPESQRRRDHYF